MRDEIKMFIILIVFMLVGCVHDAMTPEPYNSIGRYMDEHPNWAD